MKDRDLALHGLAIKKHGDAAEVAAVTGLSPARVQQALDEAVSGGRAVKAGEKYMLTPTAQVALRSSYSREFAAQRADAAMVAAYDDFERINESLKSLITEWQTISVGGQRVPNDHSDKAHDARIIDRLGQLHERAEGMLDRLARGLPRLGAYKAALEGALEKAEDGAVEWVSDARIPSYHTVWFELHEDLLRVLGRQRVE